MRMQLFLLLLSGGASVWAQTPPASPVASCAERLAVAARQEFPDGAVSLTGTIIDPGERLDYLGEAILREARSLLSTGTPAGAMAVAGVVTDREAALVVAVNIATGTARRAVECVLAKDDALARTLRTELEARRDERLAQAERYSGVLRRGVWKEGPAFGTPPGPLQRSTGPAPSETAGWSFFPQAGLELRDNANGWIAALRARSPGARWEGVLDFGDYEVESTEAIRYFHLGRNYSVDDRHRLSVRYVRTGVARRWSFRGAALPNGRRFSFPGSFRAGVGLGLYFLSDAWIGRTFPDGLGSPPAAPAGHGGGDSVRLKPNLCMGLTRTLGDSAELVGELDYVPLAQETGPANHSWGGLAFRIVMAYRLF